MNYLITEELANSIFSYLSTKPYSEVSNFINQLKSLKQINILPSTSETPEKSTTTTEGGADNVQSTKPEGEENASSGE